jgi:hypothetical protein
MAAAVPDFKQWCNDRTARLLDVVVPEVYWGVGYRCRMAVVTVPPQ